MLVEFYYYAFNHITLLILLFRVLPRIWFQSFYGEGNLAVFYFNDFDFYSVARFINSARVFNKRPIHFRDMHKSFKHFLKLYENSEVNGAGHFAYKFVTERIFIHEFGARFFTIAFFGKN